MRTMSGKISNHWLLWLCLMILAISLGAAAILVINHVPFWGIAVILAAMLVGMTSAGLFFVFALTLGLILGKK